MDPDLAAFLAAEPKGSTMQQEADRRLAALVARRRVRHRRQRGGEAAACHEPILVGDLMVWWGYGKTGARHLRCTEPGGEA